MSVGGRHRGPEHLPTQTCLTLLTEWEMSGILLLESPEKVKMFQSIMALHLGCDTCSFSRLVPLSK